MKEKALKAIKNSLRITFSEMYDLELSLYVDAVENDFRTLNVQPSESIFISACVAYAKAHFGQDVKPEWINVYESLRRQALLREKVVV